jgi:hypothetical protein
MRHLMFLFLLTFLSYECLADQLNVRAHESATLSFIEIPDLDPDPNFPARWLMIDSASGRCKLADGAWARKVPSENFTHIYDSVVGVTYNLQQNGDVYTLKDGENHWQHFEHGSWIPELFWSAPERFGVWIGDSRMFLNDPRPAQQGIWYQVGPGKTCHVFREASRTFEFPLLQTVTLESGVPLIPAWTVASGYSKIGSLEEIGNWQY